MTRLFVACAAVSLCSARLLAAQETPAANRQVAGSASVSGIVFDSLANRPLGAAVVQLVDADSIASPARSLSSDSLGRFAFSDLRTGRYLLAFFHPMLDSLGLEVPPRLITVGGSGAQRIDLAIPAARTLRATMCGAAATDEDDGLILGFIRDAREKRGIDSARVTARWLEMTLSRGTLDRTIARREAVTPETGWFAICGAPSGGLVSISARRGTDSTIALEVEVPRGGFLHRDLYFGEARAMEPTSAAANDSTLQETRYIGDGRVTGTVITAQGRRPLVGARVSIANGPRTRTDEQGAFTLTGTPTGTRSLEVRAVAHFPVTIPIDVVDGAAPVRIEMLTMQSVLDTVRITAKRMGGNKLAEFMARKRSSGSGKFLTSEDVAARHPLYTSDLFRSIAGVLTQRDETGGTVLTMRGGFKGRCRPVVFVNGFALTGMSTGDIDAIVSPTDVIGVEVYNATTAPLQFGDWNGCGSIVIWTR